MKLHEAETIADALNTIAGVLKNYPANGGPVVDGKLNEDDWTIITSVETDTEPPCEPNFYFSRLDDLIELGLLFWIRYTGWPDSPWIYEAYTFVKGVEVRSVFDQEEFDSKGFKLEDVDPGLDG